MKLPGFNAEVSLYRATRHIPDESICNDVTHDHARRDLSGYGND